MSDHLLSVEALVAGYAEPVTPPCSFTVSAGEVLGLGGANGAGKSTLLRALAGTCRIFGGQLRRRPGLRIAFLEQHPVRLPRLPLRGDEFLKLMDAHHQPPPPRLSAWLPRRIDRLSGGQFQLLCVWACLGGPAELVILDEPTNNLDPHSEALLAEFIGAVDGSRAVLLVSHERSFLEAVCTRTLSLDR